MSYKDLEVYKRSYRLALEIHNFSLTLPKSMQFDLADQIRRASRSVASNIAEAYARSKSAKDKINLLKVALGSNEEILFNLNFLKDSKLLSSDLYGKWYSDYTSNGKQLYRLIESLK